MSEQAYLDLLCEALHAPYSADRTGVGTRRLIGRQLQCDLAGGFPLLTTKKVHWRSVVAEVLWMLAGETNARALNRRGAKIWDEWAGPLGELGPIYGAQWRDWSGALADYDQIAQLEDALRDDPMSRRMLVSAWNVEDLSEMALPPCHFTWQVLVEGGRLHVVVYQRSADIFLGVPFNLAGYALIAHMLCAAHDYEPGTVTLQFGDLHLYAHHADQANEQLSRTPRSLPKLGIAGLHSTIDSIEAAHIALDAYDPHDAIRAPVAV